MTIHTSHPFASDAPDPARRLRARLGGAVTLWTAGEGRDRAGLTVTSLMVALGPTPTVVALLDPDADLTDTLRDTGRAVVQLLAWPHRDLAEVFAGTAPAPGGMFRQAEFAQSSYGPRLEDVTTWAEVSLADERELGWSVEVACSLDHIVVGDDTDPLLHRRGRYTRIEG